jgi:branched-chain amino acid transport system ATP-binding protein
VLLSLEGVTAGYGPVVALRDADLRVDEGEVVALVGPNGAGKTTLLSAVVGLVRPRTGSVRFDGRDVTGSTPEACARSGLVLVPERRRIFASLTVAENLRLATVARSGRAGRAGDADRAMLLELFPVLAERLEKPAGFLSGGEAQQLAIARGVMAAPRVLLLDEPSLGLAPLVVDAVFQLLGAPRCETRVMYNKRRHLYLYHGLPVFYITLVYFSAHFRSR